MLEFRVATTTEPKGNLSNLFNQPVFTPEVFVKASSTPPTPRVALANFSHLLDAYQQRYKDGQMEPNRLTWDDWQKAIANVRSTQPLH